MTAFGGRVFDADDGLFFDGVGSGERDYRFSTPSVLSVGVGRLHRQFRLAFERYR